MYQNLWTIISYNLLNKLFFGGILHLKKKLNEEKDAEHLQRYRLIKHYLLQASNCFFMLGYQIFCRATRDSVLVVLLAT